MIGAKEAARALRAAEGTSRRYATACPQRAPKNPHRSLGSKHPRSKLTEDQVRRFVKRVREDGRPVRDMAWIYGISRSAAYKLLRGESWTHV